MKDLHCLRITRSARDPDLSGKGINPITGLWPLMGLII